jgi:ATP-dependent NAD(P)H-hydrate dehydratase
MVHIVCHPDAAGPIKGYSPDFIVHPLMTSGHLQQFDDKIQELLTRIDALVIGPGLSRDPTLQFLAHRIFVQAKAFEIPIVLDGVPHVQ